MVAGLRIGSRLYREYAILDKGVGSVPTSRILFLTSRNSSSALHLARGVRLKHGVIFRLPCEVPRGRRPSSTPGCTSCATVKRWRRDTVVSGALPFSIWAGSQTATDREGEAVLGRCSLQGLGVIGCVCDQRSHFVSGCRFDHLRLRPGPCFGAPLIQDAGHTGRAFACPGCGCVSMLRGSR